MSEGRSRVLGALVIMLVLVGFFIQISLQSISRKSSDEPGSQVQATPTPTFPNLNITLHGAGASFPAPLIFNWTLMYHQSNPTTSISYTAVGSGKGINSLINKTGDFAASDAPLNSTQRILAPNVLHIPETIGSVVAGYNLTAANIGTGLNFTGSVLARIYLGNITKWNDPAIQSLNPTVPLPNNNITVVHRSDGSGTTFVWTSFLCLESPVWCSTVGKGTSVPWPVGVGANLNGGVAAFIASHPNAIGYVELNYALSKGIPYGRIQNPAGKFILATLTTTKYAVENSTQTLPSGSDSWSSVSLLNAAGNNTYPIASFTYLLVYRQLNVVPSMDLNETAQFNALVAFLNWAVTIGQTFSQGLYYVPLPAAVVAIDQASINSIRFSIISTTVSRTFWLRADHSLGWNLTTAGPPISVVSGDNVTLNLLSNDAQPHQWFIDFNNNLAVDSNELNTTSPVFTSQATYLPFKFRPLISSNIPLAGIAHPGYRFTYRDADNPSINGTIVVLPQQTAAVLKPNTGLNHKLAPVIDSSRISTIGTLLVDTRAQTVSGNVTIAIVDSLSGSLSVNKTATVSNLGLFRQQLKFIMVASVLPYNVSSNILVQSVSPGLSATASEFTVSRSLDVNGFGQVNIFDITAAGSSYNCALGQACYNAHVDFNTDGVVNIFDMSIIAYFFQAAAYHPP